MRSALFSLFALAALTNATLNAQEIPGETPGDLGWILYGTDTLTLVRATDGHAWLQQNLGSSAVAPAVDPSTTYGHLYQWGRWDDGHALRTSATAPVTMLAVNNPSGLGTGTTLFYTGTDPLHWWSGGSGTDSWQGTVISAANGKDPCAALGDGWQLPSQADWITVLSAEGITDAATALSANLRLPAAGSRHALSGTLINVGMFGNYWSSTPSGIYAKDLTISNSSVNADDDGYRGYGMSCRCLNKHLHTGMPEEGSPGLALFPNPSSGTFAVRCDEVMLRLVVRDALGRELDAIPVNAMTAMVELPEGLHTVCVETAGGYRHARVLIAR